MTFTTPIHTNEQSIDRVLQAGLPVLLVFTRKDCAPCQQLEPVLDRLADGFAGRVLIAKVDVQDNAGLARRHEISQVPGLVLLKDGQALVRTYGAVSEPALRAWFEYLVAGGSRPAIPTGPSVPLSGAPAGRGIPPPAQPASNGPAQPPTGATAGHPIPLTDANFNQVVLHSPQPVLVDFWAPWCGPCRMVAPAVEKLAQEFAGRAMVGKLNVDENPRTAERYSIRGIPALYIFKGGRVVEQLVGAQPAPVIRQALMKHVG